MRKLFGGLQIAVLGFSLAPGPNAFSAVTRAWDPSFMQGCDCNQSLSAAIPYVFANRLRQADEARFLDIESNLIDDFTRDTSVANSSKLILWSVYELGAYDIANALIRAHQAGVGVRVLSDGKSVLPAPSSTPDEDGAINRSFAHAMLEDIFALLKAEGIRVSYSNPDWHPVGNLYPRLMHEKVRIFAVKKSARFVPVFAYVSTHNDTYSDTIGDPLESLSQARLRQGNLRAAELAPKSYGNVQMSFLVRHAELLKNLYKNFTDQESTYGQGTGRIQDLPHQEPVEFKLNDDTALRVSYTYGVRSSFNPNQRQADFYNELSAEASPLKASAIYLNQFVFSYGKVEDALKKVATASSDTAIYAAIDARAGFQPFTQARQMAGLYSVLNYRPTMPIEYPWAKSIRKNVVVQSYGSAADRLHTKNSLIKYTDADNRQRARFFTGSINLSSNAAANKEISLEIDGDARTDLFAKVSDEQRGTLKKEGNLEAFDEAALLSRIKGTAKSFDFSVDDSDATQQAYQDFLKTIRNDRDPASLLNFDLADAAHPRWLRALGKFYSAVGGEGAGENIMNDVQSNLDQTTKFWTSIASVEVFLVLSQQKKTLDPRIHDAVLKLFQENN